MQSLWWMPIPIPVKKRPVKPTRLPPRPLPVPLPRDRPDQGPAGPTRPVRPTRGPRYLPPLVQGDSDTC